MRRTKDWEEARIRLLTLCAAADVEKRTTELSELLSDARVDAEPLAVAAGGSEPDAIVAQSAGSSVVFLPAMIRGGRFYHPFGGEITDLLDKLPIVIIATAVQHLDLDADPDEGTVIEADPDRSHASG